MKPSATPSPKTPGAVYSPGSTAARDGRAHPTYVIEAVLGGLFTLVIFYFHGLFATHAGGLWRDEANTVGLATLPTWIEVWRHLEFDSFPAVWLLVIRFVSALGLASDPALRGLGLLMGLCLIAVLWFLARTFRTGPPLFSLPLFALCPSVIIWGDSMRAHGCGIVTSLLAYAWMWRFVETGSRRSWFIAALTALLAVQTSYYNSVLVLAAGLGGFVVCLRRKRWAVGWLALAAGVPAAVSLLLYVPLFIRAAEWSVVLRQPSYDFRAFCLKVSEALADAGPWTIWLWLILLGVALVLSLAALLSLPDWKAPARSQDVILFNLVAVAVGILAYFGFLKELDYFTFSWYYVALLGFTAVGIDAILGASCFSSAARIVRMAASVVIFALLVPGAFRAIPFRLTNIDLVAAKLEGMARENDLVVVCPWFCGVTYERYNRSPAPFATIPPLDFHRFQRYDLVKKMMQEPDQTDPVRPLFRQIRETLQANGRVYFVGNFRVPDPGVRPILPPAPQTSEGWNIDLYVPAWAVQVSAFLMLHSVHAEAIEPSIPVERISTTPVNPFEDMHLAKFEGWAN